MKTPYAPNAGAVFARKDHILWCPKDRRPVWAGLRADRLRLLLEENARELGLTIHGWETRPVHVHLVGDSDPTRCVAEIVNRLKGYTSRVLRPEFPSLRSRLPTLGSRSDSAASVGHVSAATIARSIASQKGK